MAPMLLLMVALFGFMWWTNRSQEKKKQAMLGELKKGDRVITQSGLMGKLIERTDRFATVEIASGVKVKMLASALAGKDHTDSQAESKDAKDTKEAKSGKDAK